MKFLTKIQQELLNLQFQVVEIALLGAPMVFEGTESIFAITIAISATKILLFQQKFRRQIPTNFISKGAIWGCLLAILDTCP